MAFQPLFVTGGVYLSTPTGELIGQLDNPGAPFATLDDARDAADWLEMVLQFQQAQPRKGINYESTALPSQQVTAEPLPVKQII